MEPGCPRSDVEMPAGWRAFFLTDPLQVGGRVDVLQDPLVLRGRLDDLPRVRVHDMPHTLPPRRIAQLSKEA